MVDGRNVSAFAKLQNALMQQRAFRPHATASQKTNTDLQRRCIRRMRAGTVPALLSASCGAKHSAFHL